MIKNCLIIIVFLSSLFITKGQVSIHNNELQDFIRNRNTSFYEKYNAAKLYFEQNQILVDSLLNSDNPKRLIYFVGGTPLYFHSHNQEAAILAGINSFYETSYWHDGIFGQHQLIGIWDAGHVFYQHAEFLDDEVSRVIVDESYYPLTHATHVGGTIIAQGKNTEAKGMDSEAELYSSDFINDIAEIGEAADERNIILSNHSYGPVSGWSFNSDEDIWYWYGSTGVDASEDYKFGIYGDISAEIDELCYLIPNYTMVVSAGNDQGEGPEIQPVTHKVWEGKWKNSNVVRDIDGGEDGYDCLGLNGVAKNVITVGCAYKNEDEISLASFSSYGPTDDGRVKPDIVAPGVNIFSCLSDDENAYGYYSGTSMSAAVVSGGVALLNEMQYQFQPGVELCASSIKGMLIHTAENISANSGPNYQSGWGMVDFDKAHQLLEDNILSGGEIIYEGEIIKQNVFTKTVNVNEGETIKATLVWTDLPAESESTALNNTESKLINDLDLTIVKDGDVYYPFVLNPATPSLPSITGINVLDNVEQVIIDDCEGGEYIISVDASKITTDTQSFSLIVSGHEYELGFLPPTGLNGFYNPEGIKIFWYPPEKVISDYYEIYRNSVCIGTCTDSFYVDDAYTLYEDLSYSVKAVYESDETKRSCASNEINIKGLPVYQTPYHVDFEVENSDWQYSNTDMGWRYGNALSLNSTYMIFDGNDSFFMGINSDNIGDGVHVTGSLISPPLILNEENVLSVGFQYYMNNDIYKTHDKLAVYYRALINQEWMLLQDLSSIDNWTMYFDSFQFEQNEEVIQLEFLFDDNNEWGNGAGIDDFYLEESIYNVVDNKTLDFKFYNSNREVFYNNMVTNSGTAYWYLLNIEGERVSGGQTYISSGGTSFILPDVSRGIYFIVLQNINGEVVKKILIEP